MYLSRGLTSFNLKQRGKWTCYKCNVICLKILTFGIQCVSLHDQAYYRCSNLDASCSASHVWIYSPSFYTLDKLYSAYCWTSLEGDVRTRTCQSIVCIYYTVFANKILVTRLTQSTMLSTVYDNHYKHTYTRKKKQIVNHSFQILNFNLVSIYQYLWWIALEYSHHRFPMYKASLGLRSPRLSWQRLRSLYIPA